MPGRHAALPPVRALSGKAEFDQVFASNQRLGSRWFRLHLRVDNGLDHARLGMAIGRRVDKRAVHRNRLRRQIRESFRTVQSALPAVDVVVTARYEVASAARAEVWQDLLTLWSRLQQRFLA